jgi:hypothetical protein
LRFDANSNKVTRIIIDKKTFKKAIAEPLESAGFIKKGQSWYFDGKDTVVVANLQKSDWDDMYYINIGISLKALGDGKFPLAYKCHIFERAERVFPEQRELIRLGCSLDKSNLQILDDLSVFIKNLFILFLRKCSDENELKSLLRLGILRKGVVQLVARKYLQIEE